MKKTAGNPGIRRTTTLAPAALMADLFPRKVAWACRFHFCRAARLARAG
jgi:hypothetical protein